MKTLLKILKVVIIFTLLTILTQVGGFIYLLYKPISNKIKKKVALKWKSLLIRTGVFSVVMIVFSLFIVPPIAKLFGRVPMPVYATEDCPVKPGNMITTVFSNRHYVKPQLKESITQVANDINKSFPGTKIIYLDASFPFIDEFPLLPHISHNDGEKLDICFLYKNSKTDNRINKAPSLLGYGYCEGPKPHEYNQIEACRKQGYWKYSIIEKLTIQKKRFQFDQAANKKLLKLLIKQPKIRIVLIEPHLKTRLGVSKSYKVRFQGCKSVRHDDHIHLQL